VEVRLRLPSGYDVLSAERLSFLGSRTSQGFLPVRGGVQLRFPLQEHAVIELSLARR